MHQDRLPGPDSSEEGKMSPAQPAGREGLKWYNFFPSSRDFGISNP